MPRKRINEDRAMTSAELNRRFSDNAASIDQELDQALANIDWKRRAKAEKSLIQFIKTYCVGLMIDDRPSERFIDAAKEMEFALSQTRPYNIELSRGSGKTSLAEMAVLYLLASGRRKFCVIVSNNARAAGNILKDIWRPVVEKDTAFASDYPEICLPFQVCDGAYRRRQLYRMTSTDIQKNNSVIQFARLVKGDGTEFPTSGSVLTVRGITSGVRGLKVGKLRPDTVILDDLQSAESAANPEQVQKIYDIINKDILNLSSKGKLAAIMTSTPLCPEDLCEKIENDPAWKTTKYPAVIRWPDDWENDRDGGLWARYFKMFDQENAQDLPHGGSLKFYRDNREAMDAGAELFAPGRFKREDGHISGLQALMDKLHMIGDGPFSAEMQMRPKRFQFKLDIRPADVLKKISAQPQFQIPDGCVFVAASTDLNLSYAMTTVIVAFERDMTAHVVHHLFTKCRIDSRLPEAQYNQAVYSALAALGGQLSRLGVKIDAWSVDSSGVPYEAVTLFAKNAAKVCGIHACAFLGRASHVFNPFVRTRLRDAVNRTVLCGDAQEHVKAGAGKKYIFWDSDFYRQNVQKAFLAEDGAPGSCSLYSAPPDEFSDFALQLCNERLVMIRRQKDGRDVYTWKSAEPHDVLDAMAQAYATAASQGISGANINGNNPTPRRRIRPRIRVI